MLLHVRHERRLDPLDIALQDALRRRGGGPRQAIQQARRVGDGDARALLEDRLLQVALRDPDFLAEREDLLRGEVLSLML
jgi:hypothetical protein